ncbi:MAG: efflux RND transporter periplasmic adaptor subunit [Bacteroidota bacterium]
MRYLILIVALASCHSEGDHGHSHNPNGGHFDAEDETPSMDVTIWTDRTELFVEFPALIVGNISRFAAHFTILNEHQPVGEGTVTVSLIKDGKGIRQSVEKPASTGIFAPALQPKEAGVYQLVFDLKTPELSDKIVVEDIPVFATKDEAKRALGNQEENGNTITFLKEQAWKMEFQTAPAIQKEIYQVIQTSGIWRVAPSDDQVLVAPATGVLKYNLRYLTEGKPIKAGEVLMEVISSDLTTNNLRSDIQRAKATLEQREGSYNRISELYQSKVISKTDFEKAKEEYLLAKANFETLTAGFTGKGKGVIAPFNGYILEVYAKNGDFAEQGTALIKVTIDKNHMLQTMVASNHAGALENIHDLLYQNGKGEWSSLKGKGGTVISTSREVSLNNPMLSVFSEVHESIDMPDGSFTEVQIEVGKPVQSVVIPSSSLLEDYGNYSVIVQRSGENFERRNVTLGLRNGSEVEITKGLSLGEVVVTKGAYQVKMASMSGQAPAHGHAH